MSSLGNIYPTLYPILSHYIADISPAEYIWSWLNLKLSSIKFTNYDCLYEFCKVACRSFSRHQRLCYRAIRVVVWKINAMVKKGGKQLRRSDWSGKLPGPKEQLRVSEEEQLWRKHMNCSWSKGCNKSRCPKAQPERIKSLGLWGFKQGKKRGPSNRRNLSLAFKPHMRTKSARMSSI